MAVQCPPVPEALDAAHYREKLGTLGDGGLVSSPAEWSVMQGKMLRLDGDVDGYRPIRGNLGSCRGILKRKSCGITARSSSLQNGGEQVFSPHGKSGGELLSSCCLFEENKRNSLPLWDCVSLRLCCL